MASTLERIESISLLWSITTNAKVTAPIEATTETKSPKRKGMGQPDYRKVIFGAAISAPELFDTLQVAFKAELVAQFQNVEPATVKPNESPPSIFKYPVPDTT